MSIQEPLFEGQRIRLTSVDFEKDPEVEAGWTRNPLYLRMADTGPARPLSAAQIKKNYERIEKEIEEHQNQFYFAVRLKEQSAGTEQGTVAETSAGSEKASDPDGRLIGFGHLFWIEWNHGSGFIKLGIGDPADWGQGYGSEILTLLLRYAFAELNLFRLSAVIPEYNQACLHLFSKAGFVEEVRRRKALNRDGRRWDLVHMGLLRDEWLSGPRG